MSSYVSICLYLLSVVHIVSICKHLATSVSNYQNLLLLDKNCDNLLNFHILTFANIFNPIQGGGQKRLRSTFCHTRSNLRISALLEILQTCKLDHNVAIKCTWDQPPDT